MTCSPWCALRAQASDFPTSLLGGSICQMRQRKQTFLTLVHTCSPKFRDNFQFCLSTQSHLKYDSPLPAQQLSIPLSMTAPPFQVLSPKSWCLLLFLGFSYLFCLSHQQTQMVFKGVLVICTVHRIPVIACCLVPCFFPLSMVIVSTAAKASFRKGELDHACPLSATPSSAETETLVLR